MGVGDRRIIFRHILPNAIAPVLVSATLGIASAILTEAGLSFLGFGVPPPNATWGNILSDGKRFIFDAPWLTFIPGAAILLVVLSFNLFGEGRFINRAEAEGGDDLAEPQPGADPLMRRPPHGGQVEHQVGHDRAGDSADDLCEDECRCLGDSDDPEPDLHQRHHRIECGRDGLQRQDQRDQRRQR